MFGNSFYLDVEFPPNNETSRLIDVFTTILQDIDNSNLGFDQLFLAELLQ